jgi:hypothetical protein
MVDFDIEMRNAARDLPESLDASARAQQEIP